MPDTLNFDVHIARPVAVVYAHLAQPRNLIGLQPLLTFMSPIRELALSGQQGYAYETVETFRLGRIPVYHNRIRVQTILTEPDRHIDSIVYSVPMLTIQAG